MDTNTNIDDAVEGLVLVAELSEKQLNRLKKIEQILSQQSEIIRFSKDNPDKVKQVDTITNNVTNNVVQSQSQSKPMPKGSGSSPDSGKFKREPTIRDVGAAVGKSIVEASAHASSNVINQLGTEIVPFFNEGKEALKTVASGVVTAGRIGKSMFEREPTITNTNTITNSKETVTNSTSMFQKISKTEKIRDTKLRFREHKVDHQQKKLYDKVDGIHDMMRLNMLFKLKDLLPSFGVISKLLGAGGIISGVLGSIVMFKDKLGGLFVGLKDSIGKITTNISSMVDTVIQNMKSMFDKLPDFMKPQSLKTAKKPDLHPTASADKKPAIGTDKKPAIGASPDKKPDLHPSASVDKKPAIDVPENKTGNPTKFKAVANAVDAVDGKLEQSMFKRALVYIGKRLAVAATGVGAPAAIALTATDIVDVTLDALELSVKDVIDNPKSIGRAVEEKTSFRQMVNIQSGIPADATLAEYASKSVEAKERQRELANKAHQANIIAPTNTVVNNNNNYGSVLNSGFDTRNSDRRNQLPSRGITMQ
ncbi:hypothetical protein [Shewanella sp. M-Br]|uniref:hypothetical protein n=1 Tax=Shewanella sp. M-Br TaxID=2495595 RepID=UPI002948EBB7|nr:hypothetical protein SMBr_43370 [Shewanella sp. M-Br]